MPIVVPLRDLAWRRVLMVLLSLPDNNTSVELYWVVKIVSGGRIPRKTVNFGIIVTFRD